MRAICNYSSVDCESIEGCEMEPEGYYEKQNVTNIDINKVEAAECENFLMQSGYYQIMRCLHE